MSNAGGTPYGHCNTGRNQQPEHGNNDAGDAADAECHHNFGRRKGNQRYGRFNVRSVYVKKLYSKSF